MPVYNTAEYLPKSIGSILNQKYTNFELLCINDGSTDNSLNVLEKYAFQDKRIVVINKQNEGVSEARNIGIEKAKGDYICFIDSDDAMPENALCAMIKTLHNNPSAKYVKGNNLVTTSDGKSVVTKWAIPREPFSDRLLSSEDFWHYIDLTRPCVWGILFDLNYIRENELYFDTSIDFGEDALFLAQYIDNVPGVYIAEPTYDYLFARSGSLCNNSGRMSKEFYEKKAQGALTATKKFYELSMQTDCTYRSESLKKYLNWFGSLALAQIVRTARFNRKASLKNLKGYCKTFRVDGGGYYIAV